MRNVLVLLLTVYTLVAHGQTNWKASDAEVKFAIKNAGLTVNGSFSGFTGDFLFSPESLNTSRITASVAVATIKTGVEARDKHLKKEEYFNATNYPLITIQSKFFVKAEDGTYRGYFKLTLKGITKDIMIPFKFEHGGGTVAALSGSFKLNRLDYQVGKSSIILSDDVEVSIKINLVKP